MTIKEFILKLFCIKPEIKNYQVKPVAVNNKKYKTLYVPLFSGKYVKGAKVLTCGYCAENITSYYRIVHLGHFIIENGVESFLKEEIQEFCEHCYMYRILPKVKYIQESRPKSRFNEFEN